MKIESHRHFRKAYRRLAVQQQRAVDDAILRFGSDRRDPALRDHALKGKMSDLRSFSAGFDLRVIYREEGGFITVVLLDVGAHNQVY
ncbi:type II toxin-antitoxin system RelE/ParE family toxin [Haloferula sargassicola]|uniref:Type II toxin-antitoxin system mRNA interferase toxin, RelE/StbE family n=1 Tax=Haloferula sargassicola TaxID=490096 RepID=A0ABP9UM64_9BACT